MSEMHRFELEFLNDWFKQEHRKPLIIKGARQVGKSTLVRLFAKKKNLECIEIDFEQTPDISLLFESNDPTTILTLLNAKFSTNIHPENTILFLDEIQKTPEVLKCLRYFYEKMPQLAVICAGSLLDFALTKINFSMPVGRIDYLFLGPMSFQAFLLALGKKQLVDFIKNYTLEMSIPLPLHNELLSFLNAYFIVGGLPEAVERYATNHKFLESEKIKHALLNGFQEDFSKYATPAQQKRMRLIFNKVPRMLGEKFKYSHINRDEKSINIKEALDNLVLARIINCAIHTDANGLPLGAECKEKFFKAFFLDVGLVSTALDTDILTLSKCENFNLVNIGKISEQFIAQHLLYFRELYETPALYYWNREQKSSSAEIDFIVSFAGKVIPIEVKAGTSGSLKSLHYFLKEKDLKLGVRFCRQQPSLTHEKSSLSSGSSKNYDLLSLPLYLVEELKRLLQTIS